MVAHTGPIGRMSSVNMTKKTKAAAAMALALVFGGLFGAAGAVAPQASQSTVALDIPALPLNEALKLLGRQAGIQVVFYSKESEGLSAPKLSGRYSARSALEQLLANTGLSYSFVNDKTVAIRARGEAGESTSVQDPAAQMRMAMMAADEEESRASGTGADDSRQLVVRDSKMLPFSDRNVDIPRSIDDVQPYYIFDAQTLDRSGALNLEDFLKQRLTMNTAFISSGQSNQGNIGNISSINLRGLGTSRTLILINGRRAAGVTVTGSERQPDINGIPLSAVDRIEVLPTSSSGIYGGSAIGGVINIILKQSYAGGEARLSYDSPMDVNAPARTASLAYGFSLEGGRTQVMMTGQYSDSEALRQSDRRGLLEEGLAIIRRNNPAFLNRTYAPFLGATPNIVSALWVGGAPQNLTLKSDGTSLGATTTFIPAGTSGQTTLAQLEAGLLENAGSYNQQLPDTAQTPTGLRASFGTTIDTRSLMASVRRKMSERIEVFAEFSHNLNHTELPVRPYTSTYVPDTSPVNPFNEPVYISLPYRTAFSGNEVESSSTSVSVGVTAQLSANWRMNADYTRSRSEFENAFTNPYSLWEVMQSGTLNPFVDTLQHTPDFDAYMYHSAMHGAGTVNAVALRAAGPLPALPWGAPMLVVGLERRMADTKDSTYAFDFGDLAENSTSLYLGQSQITYSAYAELQVPLVTQHNAVPLVHSLDLQATLRTERNTALVGTSSGSIDAAGNITYDAPTLNGQPFTTKARYESSNPTLGLRYQPFRDVTLRASYATAFMPPDYYQLLPDRTLSSYPTLINDPVLQSSYSVDTFSGGNPGLVPQNSKSWNAGLIWEPQVRGLQGLRANVEYYRIRQFDQIGTLTAQHIIDDEATYPDRVERDPATGQIEVVNRSYVNLTRRETEGMDVSFSYGLQTRLGVFNATALATRIFGEERQNSVNTPLLDYVNYVYNGGPIRLKGNTTLTWQRKALTMGWTTRYFGSYMQAGAPGGPNGAGYTYTTLTQGSLTIPSQVYHDLFMAYDFGADADSRNGFVARLLSGSQVQLNVRNVLDEAPPFDAAMGFYNYRSSFGDIRMRSYQLSLRKSFGTGR